MAEIAVIGAGYVGLTTAACFSRLGHDVICADIDEARIALLTRGEMPIVEAGLEALVREGLEGGRLSFVVGAANGAEPLDVLLLGGLPIRAPVSHYGPFVMNTREEIAQAIDDYQAGRLGIIPADQLAPRNFA